MCLPPFNSASTRQENPFRRNSFLLSFCIVWLLMTGVLPKGSHKASGQDEDAFHSGLLAKYTSGTQSVQRVDRALSFDWGAHSPDERLPHSSFTAEWTGNLLVRLPGMHRFHVQAAGSCSIEIDQQPVLTANEAIGFASGEPMNLTAGDHSIRIRYQSPAATDKAQAQLSVFWSGDAFTLEPLPADVLSRSEASPEVDAAAHGHLLLDAHRCAACHRAGGKSADTVSVVKAPALDRVAGSHNNYITLIQRLWRPQTVVANSHMPNFDLSPVEAENVAEFLLSVSKAAHEESEIKFKDDDVSAGTKLLNSLGCVACHQLPGNKENIQPPAAPYDGPELVNVAKRRSTAWLDRWLRTPETLNANHRMPTFDLSKDERRQIVAALAQTGGTAVSWASSGKDVSKEERIAAGKRIVQESNCAACHTIPGLEARHFEALTEKSMDVAAFSCIRPAETPTARNRPDVRVPSFDSIVNTSRQQQASGAAFTDSQAIAQFVKSRHAISSVSPADRGAVLLQRNGCMACHDRNQSLGLSSIANRLQTAHPELAGQSQGLIPPPLTAVGDKLHDEYLSKAVAGEHRERRLPWLLVRMPKFKHSDADRAALMQHLISTDRIPDQADDARQDVLAHIDLTGRSTATADELLTGNQLTGAAGFNCVACHKAGDFEPRNVALGTRGSDIMTMGRRIRPRFFQRWMKNPIRVVAGIEMPAIKKAMPGILDESLPAQIGLLWKALSDDRFTPPTVTSRFEQVVNVEPNQPPRIIRDVFTIGTGKNRKAVARAMAIGFGNGHNILLDLDTMQVRLWTIGEFARQRTEGKSWYWDMGGTVIREPGPAPAVPRLRPAKDGAELTPIPDEGRLAELLDYRVVNDRIILKCRHWFDLHANDKTALNQEPVEPHFTTPVWSDANRPLAATVLEHTFHATAPDQNPGGWSHKVRVLECPSGFAVVIPNESLLPLDGDAGGLRAKAVFATSGRSDVLKAEDAVVGELRLPVTAPRLVPSILKPTVTASPDAITSVPGFEGHRLPVDTSIMPTALTWLPDGRMAFTSLKGHVWIADNTHTANAGPKNGDQNQPQQLTLFEEGLAAPFGILADSDGSIIVAHKPEILRLRDNDGDGRADEREVIASGWGYNDNYHDWTSGLIRDAEGNMFVGLGSDYSQKDRPTTQDRWRGGVIQIDPSGIITPLGMSMRYPMGLALDKHGHLFATDNQGVQNTFNEINHIQHGRHYGVPSAHQPTDTLQHETPALMVPHPWTRSVNSILFLPENYPVPELRGHGIGCEYDSRFLIRFTVQDVNGTLQGACYRFSLPDQEAGGSNFIGPICSAVGPDSALYIGSIWDSGWQGGLNTGGIERLMPAANGLPNGIREVTATADGFNVTFFHPVDRTAAANSANWSLQAYTREWGGSYATPDSGRHAVAVTSAGVRENGRQVHLQVDDLKAGYLYDVSAIGQLAENNALWPSEAHYSMKVIPRK